MSSLEKASSWHILISIESVVAPVNVSVKIGLIWSLAARNLQQSAVLAIPEHIIGEELFLVSGMLHIMTA